jgi:hypothetical protein
MKAFLNDPKVKEKYLDRVRAHALAEKSVQKVCRHFKKLGWTVHNKGHVCRNGSDLVISKGKNSRSIEVKLAGKSKRMWRVHKVSLNRRTDDLIAIVFPKGTIQVLPMSDHLQLCMSDGSRGITKLVELESLGLL